MYEALNVRRAEAGLPPYKGHGLHSEEFSNHRWVSGRVWHAGVVVEFVIDRWEAEPTKMFHSHIAGTRYVPLQWEIC